MSGYNAYALSTSLMVAAAFGIVSFSLKLGQSKIALPLIATTLLFIPLGFNESDYILGQQSHLMQCSLSLVSVLLFYRFSQGLSGARAAFVLFTILSFLTIDSVMRAALTVLAVIAISVPCSHGTSGFSYLPASVPRHSLLASSFAA